MKFDTYLQPVKPHSTSQAGISLSCYKLQYPILDGWVVSRPSKTRKKAKPHGSLDDFLITTPVNHGIYFV